MPDRTLENLLEKRDFAALIKLLDSELCDETATQPKQIEISIRINRIMCLHHVGLYRKALKVHFK